MRKIYFSEKIAQVSLVTLIMAGTGKSGVFNFSIFKALHCGAKVVVKYLLNSPAPGVTLMNNNGCPKSFE